MNGLQYSSFKSDSLKISLSNVNKKYIKAKNSKNYNVTKSKACEDRSQRERGKKIVD